MAFRKVIIDDEETDDRMRYLDDLVGAINENTILQNIDIAGYDIPEKDARELGVALGRNPHLKSVRISFSSNTSGIYALFGPLLRNITSLTIDRTNLDDRAIVALSEAITDSLTLHELKLTSCASLEFGDITPLAVALHAPTTILQHLNLNKTPVGPFNIGMLARALADNKSLVTLKMNGCDLEEEGARLLAPVLLGNPTLRRLELQQNGFGSIGLAYLVPALLANTSLRVLKLAKNIIGSEGAIALADVLRGNTTLEKLDITNNGIDQDGFAALGDALRENTTLHVLEAAANRARNTTEFFLALGVNTGLTEVNLSLNVIDLIALAAALATNTTLQALYISNGHFTGEGLRALGPALVRNTTLQVLDLSMSFTIDDRTLPLFLTGGIHLTRLYLNGCNITDASLHSIAMCLLENTTLQVLDISDIRGATQERWQEFVTILALPETPLQSLILQHSYINDNILGLFAGVLLVNTNLTSLDISGAHISDDGIVRHLAGALRENTTLQILKIGNRLLTNACIGALEDALIYNTTLQVLDFTGANEIDKESDRFVRLNQHLLRNRRMAVADTKPGRHIPITFFPPQ